jgi:phage terminase small subunit
MSNQEENKPEETKELNERQRRFVAEYLVDYNATKAAIRAKYSADSAGSIGHENLKKPEIAVAIKQAEQEMYLRLGISQERVLREYSRLAFSDTRVYFNEDGSLKQLHELDDHAAAALAGVEVDEIFESTPTGKQKIGETKKIKLWDKLKALDRLSEYTGAPPQKLDITSGGKELKSQTEPTVIKSTLKL